MLEGDVDELGGVEVALRLDVHVHRKHAQGGQVVIPWKVFADVVEVSGWRSCHLSYLALV